MSGLGATLAIVTLSVYSLTAGAIFAADQANVSSAGACAPALASTTLVPWPFVFALRLQDHGPSALATDVPPPLTSVIVSDRFPSPSVSAEPEPGWPVA